MNRYFVHHDYGMGSLTWWVWASSETEILETIAEVEVHPEEEAWGTEYVTEEMRLDALEGTLAEMRDRRTAQRGQPGYGVLAGRERVYLRDAAEEYEGAVHLSEVGPDGRMLRGIEQRPNGTAVRDTEFVINPPADLRDPKYVAMEISAEEFETAWQAAIDGSELDESPDDW